MKPLQYLMKWTSMSLLIMLMSCEEDETVPPVDDPPAVTEARDYLKFADATKVAGDYLAAADGTSKINFKDTLYLIDNHPYRGRISVLHDVAIDVTGFYVWVDGTAGSYYDVPAVTGEAKDSVDVFYLGFDPPEEDVELPYTVQIKIQPHGPDGTPVDEFKRTITVEAQTSPCEITTGFNRWQWLYTEIYNYQGELFQVTAPWFNATFSESQGGYYYAKCCIEDPDFGLIEAYPGDPTREGVCEFGNPLYKRVFIDGAYFLKAYDELFLFQDGEFWHYSATLTSNFIPQKSRICDLFAYYELDYTAYEKIGKHDYIPGANSIKMTTETATPSFGPMPPFGNFINSCHLLIFQGGSEQTHSIVYQKQPDGTDPDMFDAMDYLDMWFQF